MNVHETSLGDTVTWVTVVMLMVSKFGSVAAMRLRLPDFIIKVETAMRSLEGASELLARKEAEMTTGTLHTIRDKQFCEDSKL
jgi:hypothetical protein